MEYWKHWIIFIVLYKILKPNSLISIYCKSLVPIVQIKKKRKIFWQIIQSVKIISIDFNLVKFFKWTKASVSINQKKNIFFINNQRSSFIFNTF